MKTVEIKDLSTKELVERVAAETTALNQMKINHSISPLDNPAKIKLARRTIAQIKTELRKRELNKQ